jgi:hypothetical protein
LSRIVHIDPATDEIGRLWAQALELAAAFGAEERWTLVGGLMVQLHAFEHGSRSRLTLDADFLGDSRRRPSMTVRMAEVLMKRGARMATPSLSDENLGYRFEVDGSTIEILGSEGVRGDPKTLGRFTTIQIPGGTQALARTEIVRVSLGGAEPVAVRRPSLLGAILIKARVVGKQRGEKFESDRQDLIRLLGFVADPRGLAGELKKTEKRWLSEVESLLDLADDGLSDLFEPADLAAATGAYRLLIAPQIENR